MTDANGSSGPESLATRLADEMRKRRPHLFSDSRRHTEPAVTREVLDYQLETLTHRKQEYEFEHFARVASVNVVEIAGGTGAATARRLGV